MIRLWKRYGGTLTLEIAENVRKMLLSSVFEIGKYASHSTVTLLSDLPSMRVFVSVAYSRGRRRGWVGKDARENGWGEMDWTVKGERFFHNLILLKKIKKSFISYYLINILI